jgi:hypothetical protein
MLTPVIIMNKVVVERRIDRVWRSDLKEGVAVGVPPDDNLGSNIAPSSRPVVDDKLLPELLRQRLSNQARDNVGCGPGREADNEAHRPRRVIERTCDARHGRERGSACCQMQECATGKFHDGSLRVAAKKTPGLASQTGLMSRSERDA